MVFEQITGRDYQDYLEKEVLAPVSITALPFGDLNLVAPNLTTNYEAHEHEAGRLGRRALRFPFSKPVRSVDREGVSQTAFHKPTILGRLRTCVLGAKSQSGCGPFPVSRLEWSLQEVAPSSARHSYQGEPRR